MRFDRRFLLVVAISLAWGLLVAGVFYRLAGGGGRTRAASLRQVVVATHLLPAGSVVDRAAVTLREVPGSLFPAGAFSRTEDVLERPVISRIEANEPIAEARLALKGSGAGLGPLIPPGLRAIAVRVNDVVGVAGFALPGMRVDVLVTGKPPGRTDTETQTVLQDIEVLSVGQTTEADGRSRPIVAPVATLLVSPAQAESLTLANSEGRIQLVLRNSTDRVVTATGGRRLHELYGAPPAEAAPPPVRRGAAAPRAAAAVPLVPAAEPERMVVIQGKVKKVEVFAREKNAP
jgi:pilus assembly protein CpaB